MFHAKKPLLLWAQIIACLLVTATAVGQPAPPKPMSDDEFFALLDSRKKQVNELRELDDDAKTKVREQYQQALGEMEAAKRWSKKTAQFDKLVIDAPKELGQARNELLALPTQPTAPVSNGTKQIEQRITAREADLDRWKTALAADEAELKNRAGRRAEIPKQVSAARDRLTNINEQLQAPAPRDENAAMTSARRMCLLARRRTAEQEILSCEKERLAYEAQTDLLSVRRDLEARQVALIDQEVKQLQEMVNQRRQQEAERQAQQATWEAGQAHPAVRQLVENNAKLAEARKPLAERIVQTTRQLEQVTQELSKLKEGFDRAKEKVRRVGETNEVGLMLRGLRDELPNVNAYRQNIALRKQAIADTLLESLKLKDRRSKLANLDKQTQDILANLDAAQQNVNRGELEAAIRETLNKESEYVDALDKDYEAYLTKLADLELAEQKLINETDGCALYIDERVLWIASAAPFQSFNLRNATDALRWLSGPDACLDIGRTLAADAAQNKVLSILAAGVFLLLMYGRLRFRARTQQLGEKAVRGNCYRFVPTLETAILTVLAAVVWPGLMWYLGWRLMAAADASELCKSLGSGLTLTARVFLALQLLRHTCSSSGLGESHFGWPALATRLIRQNIRWFSPPALTLMCVAVAMAWQGKIEWDASLGRLCFIAALACFSLALYRLLRPGSMVFQAMIADRRGGWLERLRYVWYPLATLTPAVLAILAAAGYHYTARQLVIRLILTAYVLVGGVVARSLLLRWTLVNQRKLAIEQARQRRAAAQSENAVGEDASSTSDLPASAAPERDLATINMQTRRLVEYSLAVACALAVWCAWVDVLPALSGLNRYVIWHSESLPLGDSSTKPSDMQLAGAEPTKPASTDASPDQQSQRHPGDVTLGDLVLAILVLATTFIAAKNIPGLLEIAVLQHLPFDAGARYAVATVCRYVITIVGVVFCCSSLGLGWSKVQWLVAAMSLGLGFGLQEIFANFVSGLIILFERPVRVGDVVTIDAVTGVVSRIRMRATTITDGDRKELIIPNKEFITGRVLNWTLSDPINRVVVKVGIAYGSDTQRAAEILHKVANEHPHVLDDPPAGVSLESFGDSALNFVLRCFLPNLENRGNVIHELHMAIDREFREAGIEIAFPQQDVHVRSIDMPMPVFPSAAAGNNSPWPTTQKVA